MLCYRRRGGTLLLAHQERYHHSRPANTSHHTPSAPLDQRGETQLRLVDGDSRSTAVSVHRDVIAMFGLQTNGAALHEGEELLSKFEDHALKYATQSLKHL